MEDFANSWRMKVVNAGGKSEDGGGWGMVPTDVNHDANNVDIEEVAASNVIVVGDEYTIGECGLCPCD